MDSPVYVHPLGLSCGGYRPTAIERLAVSPNATLFSAAMSDPTGVCSSLITISTLSLSLFPSIYPFLFLSAPCPRIHPFTQLLLLFIPTPRCSTLALSTLSLSLSLSRLPSTGYFGSHVGGLSNETYKEHVVESGTGLKVVGSLW